MCIFLETWLNHNHMWWNYMAFNLFKTVHRLKFHVWCLHVLVRPNGTVISFSTGQEQDIHSASSWVGYKVELVSRQAFSLFFFCKSQCLSLHLFWLVEANMWQRLCKHVNPMMMEWYCCCMARLAENGDWFYKPCSMHSHEVKLTSHNTYTWWVGGVRQLWRYFNAVHFHQRF